ncbi:MAG: alpha/beta hydrolase [Thermomicrobiales bacterium]
MSSQPAPGNTETLPAVLLVHGAHADNSLWSGVILELQAMGVVAIAIANPLRALAADARYVSNAARQIDGPVLLVGHAYGGAVISNVTDVDNIVGLVFIAAYAPVEGESAFDLIAQFPETAYGPALAPSSYPNGHGAEAVEMYLSHAKFREAFCADLPIGAANALASLQRPIALAALEDKSGSPAWGVLPSWYLVASEDSLLHPEAQRFLANRSDSATTEVAASHAVPLSRPREVARLIFRALETGDVGD